MAGGGVAASKPSSPPEPVKPSPKTVSQEPSGQSKRVETATGLPVAGEKVDDILSDNRWDVAPVGSRMEDEVEMPPLPEPDLSHLTVAPVGSDMGQAKSSEAPPPPDTSQSETG